MIQIIHLDHILTIQQSSQLINDLTTLRYFVDSRIHRIGKKSEKGKYHKTSKEGRQTIANRHYQRIPDLKKG